MADPESSSSEASAADVVSSEGDEPAPKRVLRARKPTAPQLARSSDSDDVQVSRRRRRQASLSDEEASDTVDMAESKLDPQLEADLDDLLADVSADIREKKSNRYRYIRV